MWGNIFSKLKTVVIICAVFSAVLVSSLQGSNFRCDYAYFKEIDGFLKYHEIPANWREARLRCHLEGSKLATPLNAALKQAMIQMSNSSVCGVFTGLHTTFSRGDYHSVEGVRLDSIPHTWTKGEPDNDQNEEGCIVMLQDGNFADVKCSETFPYLCYKKNAIGLAMSECGTTDKGYIFEQRTKKCYKLHQYPRTWSRANMACTAEGAHLVVINDEVEAKAMAEFFSKYGVPIAYSGDYVREVAFIGFSDWTERGEEWFTIHGDTLKEAGYDKFSPGEPNNYTGQYCGAMYRSGMLDDAWCERRAQFICEKDPAFLTCKD